MLVGAKIRPVGDEALLGGAALVKKSPATGINNKINRSKDKLLAMGAVRWINFISSINENCKTHFQNWIIMCDGAQE